MDRRELVEKMCDAFHGCVMTREGMDAALSVAIDELLSGATKDEANAVAPSIHDHGTYDGEVSLFA